MAATCPACALADLTVPVPAALRDRETRLDRPTRKLLAVPDEPVARSRTSTVLLLLAVLSALSTLDALALLVRSEAGGPVHALLSLLCRAAVTVALYRASTALRRAADRRHQAAGTWPATRQQWRPVYALWQAAWLCRGCRAAFLPADPLRPDFPPSPPLSFEHFRTWLTETARRTETAHHPSPAPEQPTAPAA
ncbi:hypothetical protein [Kitasatospora cineracea]|uniref:Uncharacterized protein n=1 Tax=Kitasatospora cineracea TaxID=88074 RepID=A0A3N4R2Z9_9ACTN|nr:hypothetical protein [Kitasatospora cineracea]RPE27748.1 hypothetical protein EDD38_7036 [Kitasatospora cineracea]